MTQQHNQSDGVDPLFKSVDAFINPHRTPEQIMMVGDLVCKLIELEDFEKITAELEARITELDQPRRPKQSVEKMQQQGEETDVAIDKIFASLKELYGDETFTIVQAAVILHRELYGLTYPEIKKLLDISNAGMIMFRINQRILRNSE